MTAFSNEQITQRKFPIGAEFTNEGVNFRIWAPKRNKIEIIFKETSKTLSLQKDNCGYFSGTATFAKAGMLYQLKLDNVDYLYPDPASRFQPEGPHGPSQIIDPASYNWTDENWNGKKIKGQLIYEIHFGTFTSEGTYKSAQKELKELAHIGITVIEVMPVAEFSGNFGWGYDGVDLFAPFHLYGSPEDFKGFINEAHSLGMAVVLDVVYNHLGPDGNYLREFSDDYFTPHHHTDWGEAINYDDDNAKYVREFFLSNAAYWIEEFHIDGLRLDSTQDIHDNSENNILKEIGETVRKHSHGRDTIVVAENESQLVKIVKPENEKGYNLDGLWNDDYHHSALVALTGHNEAYYSDYLGKPQELVSAVKFGYIYQGQGYTWQKKRRGTPSFEIQPYHFINYLQNHDQIANSARGLRIQQLTSLGKYKALTALTLLSPGTPMLFQGEEFGASAPFYYFADHHNELAKLVKDGRAEFLSQFQSLATPETQVLLLDPADENTFLKSKIDLSERKKNKEIYDLHKDLIKLRNNIPAFKMQEKGKVDGAVLSNEAFVIRYFNNENDVILIINLEKDLTFEPISEPLLAPPENKLWRLEWSSEDVKYGGMGTPPVDQELYWQIPGKAAVVLTVNNLTEE